MQIPTVQCPPKFVGGSYRTSIVSEWHERFKENSMSKSQMKKMLITFSQGYYSL